MSENEVLILTALRRLKKAVEKIEDEYVELESLLFFEEDE
jgi:hypothetical protein